MDNTDFKELDPTAALAGHMQLDELIAADAPKEETKAVVQYTTPEAAAALAKLNDVKDIVPIIKQLLMAEAENKGKKLYPQGILRQQHIIAFMLCNPFATRTEICRFFSIGSSVLSNIMKSDTFKAALKLHEVTIENIVPDIEGQLKDTMRVAIDVVQRAVIEKQDPEFALAVLDKTANRLGMGTKQNTNVQINNNIVTADMIKAAREAGQRRAIDNSRAIDNGS